MQFAHVNFDTIPSALEANLTAGFLVLSDLIIMKHICINLDLAPIILGPIIAWWCHI